MPTPVGNYTKWGIPFSAWGHQFILWILRNTFDFDQAAADTIVLDRATSIMKRECKINKKRADGKNLLVADLTSLAFTDRDDFIGVVDSVSTGWQDLRTNNSTTLLRFIFDDTDGTYPLILTHKLPDDSWEYVAHGDVSGNALDEIHAHIEDERGVNFTPIKNLPLRPSTLVERLKKIKISVLREALTNSDFTFGSTAKPTYGGTAFNANTFDDLVIFNDAPKQQFSKSDADSEWNDIINDSTHFGHLAYQTNRDGAGSGFRYITIDKLLQVVFGLAGVQYSYTQPDAADMPLQFAKAAWADFTNKIVTIWSDTRQFSDFCINYNINFADPRQDFSQAYADIPWDDFDSHIPDVRSIPNTPVSYNENDTLDIFIQDVCTFFVLDLRFDVIQSGADEGNPVVYFVPLGEAGSAIPSTMKLRRSVRKPKQLSKKAVKVSYVGDSDARYCPYKTDDCIDVQLRWRIHEWANFTDGNIRHHNFMWDRSIPGRPDFSGIANQYKVETISTESNLTPTIYHYVFPGADKGWVLGAYIALPQTDTSNSTYDSYWNSISAIFPGTTDFSGHYIYHGVRFKAQEATQFGNMLDLQAIVWANLLLGDRRVLQKVYSGFCDDSGSMRSIRPGMTQAYNGIYYDSIETEQDIFGNETTFDLVQAPANRDEIVILPVQNESGYTVGGSGGSGTGFGSGDDNQADRIWLTNFPNANTRNRVKPKTGILEAIGIGANDDDDVTYLAFWDSDETNFIGFQAPSALAANLIYELPSTAPGANYILAAAAPSGGISVLSWMDISSLLTTAVITNPGSPDRNMIIPIADNVEGLAIKRYSGTSAGVHTFAIYDASGTFIHGSDSDGRWRVNNGLRLFGTVSPLLFDNSAGTSGFMALSQGTGSTPIWSNTIVPATTGTINLILRNIASQSANALEVQNSSGTFLAGLTKDGYYKYGSPFTSVVPINIKQPSGGGAIYLEAQSGATGANTLVNILSNGLSVISAILDNGFAGFGGAASSSTVLTLTQSTLGNAIMEVSSPATNDDPLYRILQDKTTTTNATATTIHTYSCSTSGRVYKVYAEVIAHRTGGSGGTADDSAGYECSCVVKNSGGTLTIIAQAINFQGESQAAWNVVFAVSGTNLLLQVVGAANNNISWWLDYSRFTFGGS